MSSFLGDHVAGLRNWEHCVDVEDQSPDGFTLIERLLYFFTVLLSGEVECTNLNMDGLAKDRI